MSEIIYNESYLDKDEEKLIINELEGKYSYNNDFFNESVKDNKNYKYIKLISLLKPEYCFKFLKLKSDILPEIIREIILSSILYHTRVKKILKKDILNLYEINKIMINDLNSLKRILYNSMLPITSDFNYDVLHKNFVCKFSKPMRRLIIHIIDNMDIKIVIMQLDDSFWKHMFYYIHPNVDFKFSGKILLYTSICRNYTYKGSVLNSMTNINPKIHNIIKKTIFETINNNNLNYLIKDDGKFIKYFKEIEEIIDTNDDNKKIFILNLLLKNIKYIIFNPKLLLYIINTTINKEKLFKYIINKIDIDKLFLLYLNVFEYINDNNLNHLKYILKVKINEYKGEVLKANKVFLRKDNILIDMVYMDDENNFIKEYNLDVMTDDFKVNYVNPLTKINLIEKIKDIKFIFTKTNKNFIKILKDKKILKELELDNEDYFINEDMLAEIKVYGEEIIFTSKIEDKTKDNLFSIIIENKKINSCVSKYFNYSLNLKIDLIDNSIEVISEGSDIEILFKKDISNKITNNLLVKLIIEKFYDNKISLISNEENLKKYIEYINKPILYVSKISNPLDLLKDNIYMIKDIDYYNLGLKRNFYDNKDKNYKFLDKKSITINNFCFNEKKINLKYIIEEISKLINTNLDIYIFENDLLICCKDSQIEVYEIYAEEDNGCIININKVYKENIEILLKDKNDHKITLENMFKYNYHNYCSCL